MSDVRQISVFVENKPNMLAPAMQLLKKSKINIRAMAIADTKDFGILRLIVNDTDKTVEILRDASYAVTVTDIVAISIPFDKSIQIMIPIFNVASNHFRHIDLIPV